MTRTTWSLMDEVFNGQMDEGWLLESLYIGLQDFGDKLKEVESLVNDQQYSGAGKENPLTSEAGESILVENYASVLHSTHVIIEEIQQFTVACIKQGRCGLAVPSLDPLLHEWVSGCLDTVLRIKKTIEPEKEKDEPKFAGEDDNSGDEWLFVEKSNGVIRSSRGDSTNDPTPGAEKNDPLESTSGKPPKKADLSLEFTSLKDRTTCIAEFIPIWKS